MTALCPAEGQVFKPCASSCKKTCDTLGKQQICSEDCSPGCECPDGKVSLCKVMGSCFKRLLQSGVHNQSCNYASLSYPPTIINAPHSIVFM